MEEKKEVKKTTTKSKEVSKKQAKPQAKPQPKTQQTRKQSEKLTKKEKTQLCIVLFVIVACIISIILFINLKPSNKENDNPQENTDETNNVEINNNKGVTEDKQIDDLKIQNTQVKKENGITYIYADVVNNGKEEQGNFYVYISMKDEKDNEIIGFETMLPLLKPGETTNISVGSTDEFVKAYKCTMTKVEEEKKE